MTPEAEKSNVAETAAKVIELLDQRGCLADSRLALSVLATVMIRVVMMAPAPLRVLKGVTDVLQGGVSREMASRRRTPFVSRYETLPKE